jgi:hypothetical protein
LIEIVNVSGNEVDEADVNVSVSGGMKLMISEIGSGSRRWRTMENVIDEEGISSDFDYDQVNDHLRRVLYHTAISSLVSPSLLLRRESLPEIRDSPGQSHHTSSNPYTGSATTNTIHARIVPLPLDIHPYQVIPQVISRQVLIEYQSP